MNNVYEKFQLSKNNHIRYWYNNDPNCRFRSTQYDVARMSFGAPAEDVTFIESLDETVCTLHDTHPNDFHLFLSGGLDSEIALRLFLRNKIRPKVVIVRFADDLNLWDYYHAKNFCESASIKPVVINFDPVAFYRSGRWMDIAQKYHSWTFYQQMLLSIVEQLSAPCLTVDEVEIVKDDDASWVFVKKEDQDACWHRFAEVTGIPSYNNFYTYNPATVKSFFKSSCVQRLINNEIFGKLSWVSSKNEVYKDLTGWQLRLRVKKHGMEDMMPLWEVVANETNKVLPSYPKVFSWQINEIEKSFVEGNQICSIT